MALIHFAKFFIFFSCVTIIGEQWREFLLAFFSLFEGFFFF